MLREIFLVNFNSIKVQLEQVKSNFLCLHYVYFNSIKVQLEHMNVAARLSLADISIP